MKTEQDELKEILIKHNALNKSIEEVVELNTDLYYDLFSYYMDTGDMPYDVMKGHYGNPDEWVMDQIEKLELVRN